MRSNFALNVNYYSSLLYVEQEKNPARLNPFYEDLETAADPAFPPEENAEEPMVIPTRDFEWFKRIRDQIAKLKNKNFPDSMQFIFESFNYESQPEPFDSNSLQAFANKYHALLASGVVIKFEDQHYHVEEKHRHEIESFVVELYQYACSEILDEFCEIKPEIFEALGLESVPKDWRGTNEARQSEVCRQLLLAYFQKVLVPLVKSEWVVSFSKAHVARQPDLVTIIYLDRYINQICEYDSDDKLKKIATTSTLATNDKQLIKSCERFFRELSLDDFKAIVARDLSSPLAWPEELRNDVKKVKIKFWTDVMSLSMADDNKKFILDFIQSLSASKISFLNSSKPKLNVMTNYPMYPLAAAPELYKRFLVRDNQIIIRYLLSIIHYVQKDAEIKHTKPYIAGDLTAIAKLEVAQTSMHYLTWETSYLLPLFLADCQQSGELRTLLTYSQKCFGKFKTLAEMKESQAVSNRDTITQFVRQK